MSEANIKGISFLHLKQFIHEQWGTDEYQAMIPLLTPATAQILQLPTASGWYPLGSLVEVEKLVIERNFGGDYSQGYQFGEYDLQKSINSVFKIFLRFLNTTFLIKKSTDMWSQMVDSGRMVLVDVDGSKCTAVVDFVDFDPIHKVYCNDIRGSLTGSLKACGAKYAEAVHTRCMLDGAPGCRHECRWG